MALGQSIIAENIAGGFRDIVKTNFPEIPFPPPGGNQFPAKSEKICPAIVFELILTALGQSIIDKIFGGDFRDIETTNFPGFPFPPPGGIVFGRVPETNSHPF